MVGERSITLPPGAHEIGRDPRVTVWLDDRRVSKIHARITVTTPTATLEDSTARTARSSTIARSLDESCWATAI